MDAHEKPFDQNSPTALFSRILTILDADSRERSEFRKEVIARFQLGDQRMSAQDVILNEIKNQTLLTNGRVNRIEAAKLEERVNDVEKRQDSIKERFSGGWIVVGTLCSVIAFAITLAVAWFHP